MKKVMVLAILSAFLFSCSTPQNKLVHKFTSEFGNPSKDVAKNREIYKWENIPLSKLITCFSLSDKTLDMIPNEKTDLKANFMGEFYESRVYETPKFKITVELDYIDKTDNADLRLFIDTK